MERLSEEDLNSLKKMLSSKNKSYESYNISLEPKYRLIQDLGIEEEKKEPFKQ